MFDVEIDPAGAKVSLFEPSDCDAAPVYWPDETVAEVPLTVEHDGHLTIPVTIDGKRLRATIDTGATNSVLSLDAARSTFDLTPESPGVETTAEARTLDGKVTTSYFHRFNELAFEGLTFPKPRMDLATDEIARTTHHRQPELLLGMHQLRLLHIYISYRRRMLYATAVAEDADARKAAGLPAVAASLHAADPLDREEAVKLATSAQTHFNAADYDAAIHDLDSALLLAPQDPRFLTMRGVTHAAMRRFDLAEEDLTSVIAVDPKAAFAFQNRGQIYREGGDDSHAAADYDRALDLDNKSASTHLARADLLF